MSVLICGNGGGHVHGSGGGRPHLSNLCNLPALTRTLISLAAKVIPHIFQIMETSAVTTRTLQGMARVRSGQLRPGPWFLTGVSAVAPGSSACTLTGTFPPVLVALRARSRLGLEGRTRTLSGPSPDLTSSVSGLLRGSAHVRQARSRCPRCCPGVAVTTLS